MIGRAGNSVARITAALAGGVDLGLYTVEATVSLKNSKGLARRGQGSRRSAAVLADYNQNGKLLLGCRGQARLDCHDQLVGASSVICLGRSRQDCRRAQDEREKDDCCNENATEHAPRVLRLV